MVVVRRHHPDVNGVVSQVMAAAAEFDQVTIRSRRSLRAAARRGRLLVAYRSDALAGWALAEPCGRRVNELGFLVVLPDFRDGTTVRELTSAAVGLRRWSVVVTMDERFARWIIADWGFARTSLGGVTRKSHGMFVLRRLAPSRLRTALSRVSGGSPIYLVRDGSAV